MPDMLAYVASKAALLFLVGPGSDFMTGQTLGRWTAARSIPEALSRAVLVLDIPEAPAQVIVLGRDVLFHAPCA